MGVRPWPTGKRDGRETAVVSQARQMGRATAVASQARQMGWVRPWARLKDKGWGDGRGL